VIWRRVIWRRVISRGGEHLETVDDGLSVVVGSLPE
jgi:hypothetical protein